MRETIEILCDLVHEMQLERGLASCYLGSGDLEIAERLENQFKAVDELYLKLSGLRVKHRSHFELFQNAVKYLPSKRKHIVSRGLTATDAIQFYSRDIISPAIEIIQELAVLDEENCPNQITSLINFLQWKERVGLERALGAQIVSLGEEAAPEINSRINYLIDEQSAYERVFLALTDDYCRNAVKNLESNNEVFQRIENINADLSIGKKSGIFGHISSYEWFALFSAKMDLLHGIGKSIAASLHSPHDKTNRSKSGEISVRSNPDQTTLEKPILEKYDFIAKLQLFHGLTESELRFLLSHSRVSNFSKGNLIFIEGERVSRFYIILEGWVKLFKGDKDGQESILKMVNNGESLLESAILHNSVFPVSAQAIENVSLLSIPSTLIREEMQNNKTLAINMLAKIADRSQELISQFEQLTLKTVTQRVGGFLLKLYLENGEKVNSVKLPYDKSLIAGYLGMKPETFSRTLQNLRKHGIYSEQNTVTMKNALKLCDYCETEFANKCNRNGTKVCKNAI